MVIASRAEAPDLDRQALELLRFDVARDTDSDLAKPTPCEGWDVADLLQHMNEEHAAICGARVDPAVDPRVEVAAVADRWLTFFSTAGETVQVPKMDAALPTQDGSGRASDVSDLNAKTALVTGGSRGIRLAVP